MVTAPIVGATKPQHLDDAIAAVDVQLTDDEEPGWRARTGRTAPPASGKPAGMERMRCRRSVSGARNAAMAAASSTAVVSAKAVEKPAVSASRTQASTGPVRLPTSPAIW